MFKLNYAHEARTRTYSGGAPNLIGHCLYSAALILCALCARVCDTNPIFGRDLRSWPGLNSIY